MSPLPTLMLEVCLHYGFITSASVTPLEPQESSAQPYKHASMDTENDPMIE